MQGTLFKVRVDDEAIEYTGLTDNQFTVDYVRHEKLRDDEIQVRVSYTKANHGIKLQTPDGKELDDGAVVEVGEIAVPSEHRSNEQFESGRLKFSFDVTNDHKPAMAWDEVTFELLFRGEPAETFTRRFGGYPGIHEDYDNETGEYPDL